MAAIFKDTEDRSPFFIACFTLYQGAIRKQLRRSTGTANKNLAHRIALELEEAGRGERDSEQVLAFLAGITDARAKRAARKAFEDTLRLVTGRGLGSKTARGFIDNWLERTRAEVAKATWVKYEKTAKLFLESLGGKAKQELSEVGREDIAFFRDQQAKRVAPSTVNISLKIIRMIFGAAEADSVVTRNEARHVKRLKDRGERTARRAFTLPELRKVLAACDAEWRSLVLFGFYTGARLGDLAGLTWQNLNLTKGELNYASRKTERTVSIPLAATLREHIETLPAGDDPKQPLHPRAFEAVTKGRVAMLSRQFGEILAEAGLAPAKTHEAAKKGKGRGARRQLSEISFHALRHTNVSLLKNAGVSDAVAQDIAGHESKEMSRLYTHIEDKVKREALDKLPVIGGGAKDEAKNADR